MLSEKINENTPNTECAAHILFSLLLSPSPGPHSELQLAPEARALSGPRDPDHNGVSYSSVFSAFALSEETGPTGEGQGEKAAAQAPEARQ